MKDRSGSVPPPSVAELEPPGAPPSSASDARSATVSRIRAALETLELTSTQEWLSAKLFDDLNAPSDSDLEAIDSFLEHLVGGGSRCFLPAPIMAKSWSPRGLSLAAGCVNGLVFLLEWLPKARAIALRQAQTAFTGEPVGRIEWSDDGLFVKCVSPTNNEVILEQTESPRGQGGSNWRPATLRSADGRFELESVEQLLKVKPVDAS